MSREILAVENLSVVFQRWGEAVPAVTDLSLSVNEGEWMMVIGHNGSGKSTLLKVLAGQIEPTRGTVIFRDAKKTQVNGVRAYPPAFLLEQSPLASTSAKLTLVENLRVADEDPNGAGQSWRDLEKKYEGMLASVGLPDRSKQLARYLSGGERQLLSLLIAQLRPSPVLLLDEPLAALDPAKERLSLQLISELNKTGRTIVQVTHDHALARTTGDRVVEMEGGRIKAVHARQPANLQADA